MLLYIAHAHSTPLMKARVVEVSKEQTIRELNDLIEKGLLAHQGKARSTSYQIV